MTKLGLQYEIEKVNKTLAGRLPGPQFCAMKKCSVLGVWVRGRWWWCVVVGESQEAFGVVEGVLSEDFVKHGNLQHWNI